MKLLLTLLLSLAFPALALPEKPNIVLILADDLGWKDVGFNGAEFFETPNLDRLATEGMTFSDGYAAAGNCAPSRACLLSGNYTPRHGVYAVGSTDRGPKKLQRLVPIPNKSGLAKDNVILAEAMKSAGYATGIFGKWHLDGKDGASPAEQGFEAVFDPRAGNPNAKRNEPQDPKGVFSITREACDFMEKSNAAGKPFFAYVSHHAIHSALEARPESLAKFKEKAKAKDGSRNPLYAACTYDLDAGVGQLMEKIRSLGIAEKTLVVFTSDNGGTQQSSQEPLRGNKGGYYEGGIREPFLAVWPGVIQPGSKSAVPVVNVDFYPTFLALAGGKPADGKQLDGTDLTPLLTGKDTLAREAVFWHFPGYLDNPVIRGRESDVALGFRSRPVSVIRKGNWKLHLFHEEWVLDGGKEKLATNGAVELYDLANDPGERHDLATKENAKRDELLADLLAWISSTKAPLSSEKNPAYDEIHASVKLHRKTFKPTIPR